MSHNITCAYVPEIATVTLTLIYKATSYAGERFWKGGTELKVSEINLLFFASARSPWLRAGGHGQDMLSVLWKLGE